MNIKPIKWATPEQPRGLWAACVICGKDLKHLRTRKNVCSETCRSTKQRQIDSRSYAAKLGRDPQYAKKQSARQYARIKSDPERLAEHREKCKAWRLMPNYKASAKKSLDKYRASNRDVLADRARAYRMGMGLEWVAMRQRHEARRQRKRSEHRAWLKTNDPQTYVELRDKERLYEQQYMRNKRLLSMKQAFSEILEKDSINE